MIIIPIGIDCDLANLLRKNKYRNLAYPFDWNVTYEGISEVFKNDFKNFVPPNIDTNLNRYGIKFYHDKFPEECEKYETRIMRLKNILETSREKIIFFRKGHASHHHDEYESIANDIYDAEKLHEFLNDKYPKLNYDIIVVVVCGKCFDCDITYVAKFKNIKIFNIVTDKVDDMKFENLFKNIYSTLIKFDNESE